jgi:two-component system nitrate/nitrite sensor histidine kinase NarX
MLIDTSRAYRSQKEALAQIASRVFDERSDERRLIAADLHDEVLQPLFKVTLMAHVLKADLSSGRLLELDQDLPELLTASELASNSLRELIGDLRRSSLGRGGLAPALMRLVDVDGIRQRSSIPIDANIEHVSIEGAQELAIYQVAKEALLNAVNHSHATHISVSFGRRGDDVTLSISDNGIGFNPHADNTNHYGLEIMKERADGAGGLFYLDTGPGSGCTVRCVIRA